VARQHAPVADGQISAAHAVPFPWNRPPWPTHVTCELEMHVPSGRQQAPTGGGHCAFWQAVPLPRNTPWRAAQSASLVTTQNPFGRQHAPPWGWHVVVVQVVPGPRKTPCWSKHWAAVSTWHSTVPDAADGMQQAPVGWVQFAFAQELPLPW
jgi:hypothetical protein